MFGRNPSSNLPNGNVSDIQPGQEVAIRDIRYRVVGTIVFNQGGSHWAQHALVGITVSTPSQMWLGVDPDGFILALSLWIDQPIVNFKPTETISYLGGSYQRSETGEATYTTVGLTGLPPAGRTEFNTYSDVQGQLLSVERFDGGEWKFSTGMDLNINEVGVYPAG